MRKFRLKSVIAAFLLLSCMLIVPALPQPAEAAEETLKVRVGLYDNKPKIWRDENGAAQGMFADILGSIAEAEAWELEYVYGTWDECMARLAANEIDIMPDVAVSEDRLWLYDFNEETVLVNWGTLYTRPGIEIGSIMDLDGKRIAAMKGGILYDGVQGLKSMLDSFGITAEIIDVQVYGDVFELLDLGEADVGVVNRVFGIANEKDYDIRRTNIIFDPSELRYAFTKGASDNDYLISRIDYNLRQLKADNDSVYHQSLTRHMGGIIERVEVFPRWFKYLVSGTLVAFATVLIYILIMHGVRRRLKALVRSRTVEIEKEKSKLRLLFDGSNDAIVLLETPSLKIVDCNSAALRMIGLAKKEDMIGKTPIDLAPPVQPNGVASAEVAKGLLAEVFEKNGAFSEWALRSSDGADIFTEVTFTLLEIEGKQVVHTALRDITSRRLDEEKVRSFENLKSRFITALTHVTRTPLNRIRWAMEGLETGEFGKISDEGAVLIHQAISSDYEVLRLIDNMNIVLDIERGPMMLNMMPTSLLGLVLSVKTDVMKTSGHEDVNCEVVAPKTELPTVDLDMERARWAISSLLDNAIKYSAQGKKKVKIELKRRNGRVRCNIIDTGIGIPKTEQPHVFGRFFRASNAPTAYPDGVGIDLYIAKAIVEAHGGNIGFESEEGKGSTFWVEFPAVDERGDKLTPNGK